jgi:hypothetical protein
MADSLAGSAVDAAYDPRVSPVARKFLSLLSGRECSPSAKTGGLAAGAYTRPQPSSTRAVFATETSRAPHHMGQNVLTLS